jgi:membrane-associated phospholipid phosphatase
VVGSPIAAVFRAPGPLFCVLILAASARALAAPPPDAAAPPAEDSGVDTVSGAGVPDSEELPTAPMLLPFADAFVRGGPPRKPGLVWKHTRFRDSEYVALGGMLLAVVPSFIIQPSPGRFPSNVGVDESARSALRIEHWEVRQTARDASDVLLTLAVNYPLIVDAVVVAGWYRDAPDVGWELAMIDLEALVVNATLAAWTSALSSRERPYGRLCPKERALQDLDCSSNNRYRSYFSGHTSTAFVSAGLMCMHHANVPLYGGGVPDGAACGLALGAAGTMAYLRVAADQHYLSDVLTGAAVGSAIGFGLPWALHYREPPPRSGPAKGPRVTLLPAPNGAHVLGTF